MISHVYRSIQPGAWIMALLLNPWWLEPVSLDFILKESFPMQSRFWIIVWNYTLVMVLNQSSLSGSVSTQSYYKDGHSYVTQTHLTAAPLLELVEGMEIDHNHLQYFFKLMLVLCPLFSSVWNFSQIFNIVQMSHKIKFIFSLNTVSGSFLKSREGLQVRED